MIDIFTYYIDFSLEGRSNWIFKNFQ